jgi:hypothetical protein
MNDAGARYRASVVGVATLELVSGECSSALGVDLASVDSAPCEEFGWLYDDLFDAMASCLDLLKQRLHVGQPMLIVRLEVGVN